MPQYREQQLRKEQTIFISLGKVFINLFSTQDLRATIHRTGR